MPKLTDTQLVMLGAQAWEMNSAQSKRTSLS